VWVFDENTIPRSTPKLEAEIPVDPSEFTVESIIEEVKSWEKAEGGHKARR